MSCSKQNSVKLEQDSFGSYIDKSSGQTINVQRFTWKNDYNVSVQAITYGATITTIKTPDKNGEVRDIVMGFDTLQGYQDPANRYFGATVGRVANRIGYATFSIGGKTFKVTNNLGQHQLHGGHRGFDKVNWDYYIKQNKVIMSYLSPDNEEGFPGNVLIHVSFELTESNEFLIDFKATTTKPTYVNLTNHSYFNLSGHDGGSQELYKHVVVINADNITDVDNNFIPTGKLIPVMGTTLDLLVPKVLGDVIHKVPGADGYDHNFCINKGSQQVNTFVARIIHPQTGRVLEVYSNQPGVQFYTSNNIPENANPTKGAKPDGIHGKNGKTYYKHGALCLETQNWPDAINHKNFPDAVLYPEETYHHSCVYKFFIKP